MGAAGLRRQEQPVHSEAGSWGVRTGTQGAVRASFSHKSVSTVQVRFSHWRQWGGAGLESWLCALRLAFCTWHFLMTEIVSPTKEKLCVEGCGSPGRPAAQILCLL